MIVNAGLVKGKLNENAEYNRQQENQQVVADIVVRQRLTGFGISGRDQGVHQGRLALRIDAPYYLGFAASANIGDTYAVFEPTHGSAPKYAGLDKVNPIAMWTDEDVAGRRAAIEEALGDQIGGRLRG